ncbi:unnamed protein product [Cyclocybe aegerita]|uniref:Uncharacterized protein n=1 Tax=Cyclocybe aegerita TaxID=1973307 RepID=A0A8S0W177_CYCAE|nr:unnamed protein product [Cyclocybe aegerita]
MKLSSIFYAFTLFVAVAQGSSEYDELEARQWLDDLSARELVLDYHARSGVLEEFSTRELIDELQGRLERRGQGHSKPKPPPPYVCPYCGAKYNTAKEAKDCSKFCKAK